MRNIFIHSNNSGAVIPLVGIMLSAFVLVSAMVVDISSVYTVQGKLQQAVDSALLGAASTHSDNPKVSEEFNRMLRVNFPDGYMGARLPIVTVLKNGNNVFSATVSVSIRYPFSSHLGANDKRLTIVSEVTNGYNATTQMRAEVAVVVDNTLPVGQNNRWQNFKSGVIQLSNMLYGNRASTDEVLFSIVPFADHIALENQYKTFVTNAPSSGNVFIKNGRTHSDYNYTDKAPNPTILASLFTHDNAMISSLATIRPAMNSKAAIQSYLNGINSFLNNGGIDIGVEWGWYTLSPAWQGKWITSYGNGFPSLDIPGLKKVMVLIVSANNTLMPFDPATEQSKARMAAYCTAIKNKGYKIFTILYNDSSVSNITSGENLLRNCATQSSYYFVARSSSQMTATMTNIGNIINSFTIRLSQ